MELIFAVVVVMLELVITGITFPCFPDDVLEFEFFETPLKESEEDDEEEEESELELFDVLFDEFELEPLDD